MASNYSGAMSSGQLGSKAPNGSSGEPAAYFEGTNILVYIRGTDDDEGRWWESGNGAGEGAHSKGVTLVNAHYDS